MILEYMLITGSDRNLPGHEVLTLFHLTLISNGKSTGFGT